MTPDIPSLSQHLLTRADLAKLAVPAGDVERWLAAGNLQRIGALSPDGADGEPVFAVTDRALREDLAARLAGIGKDEVVFSPVRVRSVLTRALMALHGVVEVDLAEAAGSAAGVEAEAELGAAEAIGDALSEIAKDLEGEVERFLAMAREEAQMEALERAAEFAAQEALATPSEPVDEPPPPEVEFDFGAEPEVDAEAPAEADFFDVDDLTDALSSWGPEPEPTATTEPQATDTEPAAEAAPTTDMTEAEPEVDPPQNAIEADVFAAFDAFEKPTPAAMAAAMPGPAEPTIQKDVFAAFDAFEQPAAGEPSLEDLVEPEAARALAADEPLPTAAPSVAAAPTPMADPDPIAGEPAAAMATVAAADAEPIAVLERHTAEPVRPTPRPAAAPATAMAAAPAPVVTPAMPVQAVERVESFLSELKSALLEIAQRPQPVPPQPQVQVQAVDMQPLVAAVGEFGQRVEHGVAIAVHAAMSSYAPKSQAPAAAVPYVQVPTNRNHFVLLTVTLLLTCWAAIFWLKTGSANLALGTFLGANAIACCLLVGQRR